MLTGAELLIRALADAGVRTVFGYPGAAVLPVFDALRTSDIRFVLTRTEQGAGHAASGYSRAGEGVGVVMTTSGPGATNLITAVATAYMDSVPMLAVTGQVSSELLGRDVFQEADVTGAVMPFVKHSYLIQSPDEVVQTVRDALHIAVTGRPGPVLIDFPIDRQQALAEYVPAAEPCLRGYKPTVRGHAVQVARAVEAIAAAKRPLLVAGGGVFASHGVREFRVFAQITGIPVVHTMMGKGVMPADDPQCLGMVGAFGREAANRALTSADLIVLVGARVGDRAVATPNVLGQRAAIIHIDVDPAEIGKNVSTAIPIVGDAKTVLRQLLEKMPPLNQSAWRAELAEMAAGLPADGTGPDVPAPYCTPRAAVEALSRALSDDAVYVSDVGMNQIWSARWHDVRRGKFLTSCGMGTMGYAIPAALGASCACPGRQVAADCGDGAFMMALPELAVLRQEGVPVKVAVFRDDALGMIEHIQRGQYGGRLFASALPAQPDFGLLAQSFGLPFFRASHDAELRGALAGWLGEDGPALLEIRV